MNNDSDGNILKRKKRKRKKSVAVSSGDKTQAKIKNRGIWKRFFHTLKLAKIPAFALSLYVIIYAIQCIIAVKVPQINANFFAGDASIKSISLFLGVEILTMVISQIVLYINYHIRAKMNRNLRNALWGKILRLKPKYFDTVSSNTLISRITVDSESVNEFFMDIILNLVFQVYVLVLTIYEMSTISIKAGLVLLAFVPFSFVYSFVMGRISLKLNNSLKFKMSDMTAYLSDLVSCLPLIKAFNRQGYERRRGEKVIDEYYKANKKIIILDFLKAFFGSVIGIGPEICIILFGIKMLGDGTVDAAGWYTFYLYAGVFIGFFNTLGTAWQNSKTIQGSLNKVSDVLYEEEESVEPYLSEIKNSDDIIFDNVSFGYEKTNIFENINFTIPKNKNTVIIGYSGAGKSTLLKLIERIYEPTSGKIMTGGKSLSDFNVKDWRQKIAYVSQSTPLLSGTIRENILYGINRQISDDEIMQAAKLASVDEFINDCPDGLEYEVGQFGTRLSGGQKQKISITRAILSDAEILILDEPTASLDIISANDILNTIEKLKGTRTVIVVTHNVKSVRSADHIIVVNQNHTVDSGSEEQMRTTNEFMYKLVNS